MDRLVEQQCLEKMRIVNPVDDEAKKELFKLRAMMMATMIGHGCALTMAGNLADKILEDCAR